MQNIIFLLLLLMPASLLAQTLPETVQVDSVSMVQEVVLEPVDSLSGNIVDTIQHFSYGLEAKTSQLQQIASQPQDSLQAELQTIQFKLDSLSSLATQPLDQTVDSLKNLQTQLEGKLAKVQGKVARPLEEAGLPSALPEPNLLETTLPEMEGMEISKDLAADLPGTELSQPDLSEKVASELDIDLPENAALLNVQQALPELLPDEVKDIGMLAGQYKLDSLPKGEAVDKLAEQQLLKTNQGQALQNELQANPLQQLGQQDAKNMAGEMSQEAIQSTDLLGDKVEMLQLARGKLDKYKGRYKEIKSLKDLPKNPFKRHPLADTAWYKRLVPGLQYQIGKDEVARLDIGPRIAYQITDLLQIGAYGMARVTIGKSQPTFFSMEEDRLVGYGVFLSHAIKKGFYGQLAWENLNVTAMELPNTEPPLERPWVKGLRVGLGKRYRIYKKLQGYTLAEYSLSGSIHTPYRRQLQLRMGIIIK